MCENPETIIIRELSGNDVGSIMAIEPFIYGEHHWSKATFINELTNDKSFYYGAFDKSGENLLGYTGFWLITGEAHITTLAVHPDYRRKSIGERLLINTVVRARELGGEWLTLEVRESNEAAKGLYFKYGFSALGKRKNYYQDNGETALILWSDKLNSETFESVFNARVAELGLDPVA